MLICGIAFWWRLGSTGLVDETEPLFAEASRLMTVTGDWVTPYFNGANRFDKPPLVYWMMAIAFKVTGINEWAVRFPSALAATGLTAFGFYLLQHYGTADLALPTPRPHEPIAPEELRSPPPNSHPMSWFVAWLGSAMIALNLQTLGWARIGVSDMLLSGCVGASLFAFFLGYAQPHQPQRQTRWYLAFYVLSALAVLAKGPVGIVLPGGIILGFLLLLGNFWTVLREMQPIRGGLIFLAITLPWYILVTLANGRAYIDSFFGYHNLERFTQVVNNHWAPWFFYFVVVPVSFLPWSVYLPVAIARLCFPSRQTPKPSLKALWPIPRWRQQPRSSQLGLFALVWFLFIFAFFTLAATKLPSYTLPLLPAAAILVTLFWRDQMLMRSPTPATASHLAAILLSLLLAIGAFLSPRWMDGDRDMPDLSQTVEQLGLANLSAWVWLGMAIAILVLLWQKKARWIWQAQLIGFLAFIGMVLLPFSTLIDTQRQLPLRQLAAKITEVRQPRERLVMAGYNKPSLVFYTQQPFTFVSQHDQVRKHLRQLTRRHRRLQSVLLVVRSRKIPDTQLQPNQYESLAKAGVFELIRVRVRPRE
jgi:4-amino-4-deoxy-L-arabinose transferase-like glycosyltransferase